MKIPEFMSLENVEIASFSFDLYFLDIAASMISEGAVLLFLQ